MDSQIIRDLFSNCIEAAQVLDTDVEFRKRIGMARARLAFAVSSSNSAPWPKTLTGQAFTGSSRRIKHNR